MAEEKYQVRAKLFFEICPVHGDMGGNLHLCGLGEERIIVLPIEYLNPSLDAFVGKVATVNIDVVGSGAEEE